MQRKNNGRQRKGGGGGSQVTVSEKEYRRLLSRPKPKTLARDERQGRVRKGKASNPYLQTLLDPIHITGVKVPDVTSFPSCTFQVYQRGEFNTGASPTARYVITQPVIQDFYTQGDIGSGLVNAWGPADDYAAMSNIFHMLRPVSGLIRVWTEASALNNQGELVAVLLPQDQNLNTVFGTGTTIQTAAKRFSSFRTPLKTGVELLWMPSDPRSRQYTLKSFAVNDGTVGLYPALAVAWDGAAANTTIIVEYFWNFEAVPEDATFNLVNASHPYISGKDAEEATGIMTKLGTLARPFGEDLVTWLQGQGAVVAGEVTKHLIGAGVHYLYNSVGLKGGVNRPSAIIG